MNSGKQKNTMFCNGVFILFSFFIVGCSGASQKNVSEMTMSNNVSFWMAKCETLKPGEIISALPEQNASGVRIFSLKWDTNCEVSVLLRKLDHVTPDMLGLKPMDVKRSEFAGDKICDLSYIQQAHLRDLWERRIVSALTTKYYDTQPYLLADGLKKDELVFYYFLGGRHNSPEMGFSDVVQILCVNARKQLVSKNAVGFASGYPLHFIDQTGQPADYLF